MRVHKARECVCLEDEVCFGKGSEGANVSSIGGEET